MGSKHIHVGMVNHADRINDHNQPSLQLRTNANDWHQHINCCYNIGSEATCIDLVDTLYSALVNNSTMVADLPFSRCAAGHRYAFNCRSTLHFFSFLSELRTNMQIQGNQYTTFTTVAGLPLYGNSAGLWRITGNALQMKASLVMILSTLTILQHNTNN